MSYQTLYPKRPMTPKEALFYSGMDGCVPGDLLWTDLGNGSGELWLVLMTEVVDFAYRNASARGRFWLLGECKFTQRDCVIYTAIPTCIEELPEPLRTQVLFWAVETGEHIGGV